MSPEQRRDTIVAATIPLVREHGFDVSTRQIAEAVGVAEGTLFRVFDDKDSLLRSAVRASLDPSEAEAQLTSIDMQAPLAARVEQAAVVLQQRMFDVLRLAAAVGLANVPQPESGRELIQFERMNELLTAVFEPDRDVLSHDPAEAARLLRIIAFGGSHARLTEGPVMTPAEVADLLLHGIVRDTTD